VKSRAPMHQADIIPSPSKLTLRHFCTASSVVMIPCSFHVRPSSLRKMLTSRSRPRSDAKCGTSSNTGLHTASFVHLSSMTDSSNILTLMKQPIHFNISSPHSCFVTIHSLYRQTTDRQHLLTIAELCNACNVLPKSTVCLIPPYRMQLNDGRMKCFKNRFTVR